MNLTVAREILLAGLHSNTNVWSTTQQDHVIMGATKQANEGIGILRKYSIINTVASSAVLDFTTAEPDFDPTNLRNLYIKGTTDYDPFHAVNAEYVRHMKEVDTGSRQPEYVGFETKSRGLLHPTPDAIYPITFIWIEDEVSWTAPHATPANITFGIPDRLMYPILQIGGAALMTRSWPANKSALPNMKEFQDWIDKTAGTYGSDSGVDYPQPILD